MSENTQVLFSTLHFFGRMNVHLTHELQNVMATISETSGLLDDLVDMYATSGKPDFDRISSLTERISEEVRRGHKLVSRINGFAHGTDEPAYGVELSELVRFMAASSTCMPYAREVNVSVKKDMELASFKAYYLQQVLYDCFTHAFAGLPPEASVHLEVDGSTLVLSGLASDNGTGEAFPAPSTLQAASMVGATLAYDGSKGRVDITLA